MFRCEVLKCSFSLKSVIVLDGTRVHQHLMLWRQSTKKRKKWLSNHIFLPLWSTQQKHQYPYAWRKVLGRFTILYFRCFEFSFFGLCVCRVGGRRGVTTTLSVINHNFKVYCWSHAKSRRYCIYCPPKKRSRCADTPMGHIRHKIWKEGLSF